MDDSVEDFEGQEGPGGPEGWEENPEAEGWEEQPEGQEGQEEYGAPEEAWDQDGEAQFDEGEGEGGETAPQEGGKGRRNRGNRGGGKGGKGKDASGAGGGGGKKGGGKAAGLGAVKRHAFKILCTDIHAANIIGARGATRQQIEDETGCSVWISKRDEVYPAPAYRILVLHADEVDQVVTAFDRIIDNLVEVAGRNRQPDAALLGKEEGDFILNIALPTLITGKLIGTKGANIVQMREKTGAKILIDNDAFDGHKAAKIESNPDTIRHVVRLINDLIQEEAGSEEYCQWASLQPFADAQGKGGRRNSPRGRRDAPRDQRDQRDQKDHRERDRDHRERRDDREHREPRDQRGQRDRDNREHRDGRDNNHRDRRGEREAGGRARSRERSPRRDRSRARGQKDPALSKIPDGLPMDTMGLFAREFRVGELQQNHAVSSVLPRSHLEPLMERGGEYLAYIQKRTGSTITIQDDRTERDFSNVMIAGPLPGIYLAHMAVMKAYHDKEYERERKVQEEQQKTARVSDLQAQLASLESQLREAHSGTRGVSQAQRGARGGGGGGGANPGGPIGRGGRR